MIYIEKSQPGPGCLEEEKKKKNGDHNCGNVLERLKKDFKDKCYICEQRKLTNVQIDHFIPVKINKELKCDWNNLFYSCPNCNGIKHERTGLLNCTKKSDKVDSAIRYLVHPMSLAQIEISIVTKNEKTENTQQLLYDVYFGNTKHKKLESSNLRDLVVKEVQNFSDELLAFEKTTSAEDKERYYQNIINHLNNSTAFTAFKRWIISTF